MDEADLQAFVDGARDRLSASSEMSTRTTELRVVLPLLKALGWEIHGPEVVAEYGVRPPAGSGEEGTGEDGEEGEGTGSTDDEPTDDADGAEDADRAADEPEGGDVTEDEPAGTDEVEGEPGDVDGVEDEPRGAEGDGERGTDAGSHDPDPAEELTVDYALCLEGEPAVLLATGAAGEPVDRATVDDLEAAMTAAGVDVGLATNGRSYVLLGRRGDGVERVTLDLADLAEDPSPLAHYSRAGARHRRLRERRERRRAVAEELSAGREAAVEGVAAAIAGESGADLDGELAAAGEAFVDRVVDALSTGAHPETAVAGRGSDGQADAPEDGTATEPTGADAGERDAGEPGDDGHGTADAGTGDRKGSAADAARSETAESGTPGATTGSGASSAGAESAPGGTGAAHDANRRPGDGDGGNRQSDAEEVTNRRSDGEDGTDRESDDGGEYVVRFFDDSASVGAVGHGTPEGAMAQAVEYLFEQRGLDSRLDPPWGPEDAPGRAILNRAPVHPDGTEMAAATQLSNGYFLYTDLPAPATRRVVGSLTRKAGLRAMFQGEWADGGR